MRRTLAFNLLWRLSKSYLPVIVIAGLVGICYVVIIRGISPDSTKPLDVNAELYRLEWEVDKNRHELARLRNNLRELEKASKDAKTDASSFAKVESPSMTCVRGEAPSAKTDYNIWSIIQNEHFTNEDGGAWKQGWPIEYDSSQWTKENKLKVFVVPHSHNDPGWIKTFDKYYADQTKSILSLAVQKLIQYPEMRFIWAEISFFSRWYEEQPQLIRNQVKKLVNDGKLEFVTGGWVMNDEANTHYYAMIEQLVLGHEWIVNNLGEGIRPRNGWAIDPFGLSPTMAYLLKGFGLENMVIQRIHYFLKKFLGRSKALEFQWRQHWDDKGSTDIFCHTMPFYSYDVPHTCGPEPAVCCQFDFKRMSPSHMVCPWKIPPVPINEANLQQKAMLLLDQYRKKAQLYQTNSLLVPLGDDFRYDQDYEWDRQFLNYKAIMNYVNSNASLNTQIHFGTLEDYFKSVQADIASSAVSIPTLSGDFLRYADKDNEFFSGFYTSRPFYKFLDRRVESTLRTAEIVYSLALALGMKCPLTEKLMTARKGLSLFQHHDGITGTAKTHVMQDYGEKLTEAVRSSMTIIKQSTQFLLGNTECIPDFTINLNGSTEGYSSRVILDFTQDSYNVSVVNSLTEYRREIVSIYSTSSDVTVKGVPSQLSPVFEGCVIKEDLYELSFQVELRPFEIKSYQITKGGEETAPQRASVTFYKSECKNSGGGVFQVSTSTENIFKLQTSAITATFSAKTGLLTRLTQNAAQASVEVSFWKFSTPSASATKQDRSGAYLFMPDNESPSAVRFNPTTVVVIGGSLLNEVMAITPEVRIHFRLKSSPGIDGQALEIHNVVDIRSKANYELLMKIATSIESNSIFTDLNGFSFAERKYQKDLPLQGNVHPLSAMLFLQDSTTRLSLASGQPLGVTDRKEKGSFYVFLDRRLNQDDNRGLGQTVTDNIPALSSFRLILESQEVIDPRPSLVSILSYRSMSSPNLPIVVEKILRDHHSTSSTLQPCGMHVVNVRSMIKDGYNAFLLTLHNEAYSCSEVVPEETCQITTTGVDVTTMFGRVFNEAAQYTSFSDLYPDTIFHITENIHVPVNKIKTIRLSRQV